MWSVATLVADACIAHGQPLLSKSPLTWQLKLWQHMHEADPSGLESLRTIAPEEKRSGGHASRFARGDFNRQKRLYKSHRATHFLLDRIEHSCYNDSPNVYSGELENKLKMQYQVSLPRVSVPDFCVEYAVLCRHSVLELKLYISTQPLFLSRFVPIRTN